MVTSTDGNIEFDIAAGTIILNADGTVPTEISITPNSNPPTPPAGQFIIGAYTGSPSGLTFNPPGTMIWSYNPASLPAGVDPSSLQVAFYNSTTGKWELIPCTVDPITDTITATVAHFSTFAILGSLTETTSPQAPTTTLKTTTITTTTTISTKPVNWGLIGGIIGAVVVIGIIIAVVLMRRRA